MSKNRREFAGSLKIAGVGPVVVALRAKRCGACGSGVGSKRHATGRRYRAPSAIPTGVAVNLERR